ncbi:hypothetical protein C8R43DRAFT_982884 [Mycena crocata]|nr:hypothetical protein C8R43DRAFT_982884 [Mycena crocata]
MCGGRCPYDPRLAALVGRIYPSLTEFTLKNQDMGGAARALLDRDQYLFPALTHLHISSIHYEDLDDNNAATLADFRERFPRLTHVLLGALRSTFVFPSDLSYTYTPMPVWTRLPLRIPPNLTVVVEPGFSPLFTESRCSHPDFLSSEEELAGVIDSLAGDPLVHMKHPLEEDYRSGRGVFDPRRTIAEFVDRARGGYGAWGIPPQIKGDDWWINRPSEQRDKEEL